MTALITIVCMTLASAISAGAFVYGRQIGYTKREAELQADSAKALADQYDQLALEYRQLEMQFSREQLDNARNRSEAPRGWDPEGLDGRR
ncbi:hypothetical protein D3C71_1262910 [compost metagenome]